LVFESVGEFKKPTKIRGWGEKKGRKKRGLEFQTLCGKISNLGINF